MAFKPVFETEEQEAARLAESTPGSKNYMLSFLPVTLRENPQHLLVRLPREAWSDHNVIVFVEEGRPMNRVTNDEGLRQRTNAFKCSVVASDDPRYPVGGYKLIVPETELRRGSKIELDPATGQRITD